MFGDSFFTGLFLLISSACGFTRHFVFEPKMVNYPTSPGWLQWCYFIFAVGLFYLGSSLIIVAFTEPPTIPPQAQPKLVLLSLFILEFKVGNLINVLRQRYPADVWRRLNRINIQLRCSRAK